MSPSLAELHAKGSANETQLAEALGVSRGTVRSMRALLTEGQHYQKEARVLRYTAAGIQELARRLELSLEVKRQPDAAPPPGGRPGGPPVAPVSSHEGAEDVPDELPYEEPPRRPTEPPPGTRAMATVTNTYIRRSWSHEQLVSAEVDGTPVRLKVPAGTKELYRPGMTVEGIKDRAAGLWVTYRRPRRRGRV